MATVAAAVVNIVRAAAPGLDIDPEECLLAIDWAAQIPVGPHGEVDERAVIRLAHAWADTR